MPNNNKNHTIEVLWVEGIQAAHMKVDIFETFNWKLKPSTTLLNFVRGWMLRVQWKKNAHMNWNSKFGNAQQWKSLIRMTIRRSEEWQAAFVCKCSKLTMDDVQGEELKFYECKKCCNKDFVFELCTRRWSIKFNIKYFHVHFWTFLNVFLPAYFRLILYISSLKWIEPRRNPCTQQFYHSTGDK